MADTPFQQEDRGGTKASHDLVHRHPHLRDHASSSPFQSLGTRLLLQKHLLTPDSATSMSSFEEGASIDGVSEMGTPAMEAKRGTKRLSCTSRDMLVRSFDPSSSTGDGVPEDIWNNLVIKTVPTLDTQSGTRTPSTVPWSPLASKGTRQEVDDHVLNATQSLDVEKDVVRTGDATRTYSSSTRVVRRRTVSPVRRVMVHKTGTDSQVHDTGENVEVNCDNNVPLLDSDHLSTINHATNEGSSQKNSITHRVVRRVVVREDGTRVPMDSYSDSDGYALDDGDTCTKSVQSFKDSTSSVTSDTSSGHRRRVITRRVVSTPGKRVRRTVVHSGTTSSTHQSVLTANCDVTSSNGGTSERGTGTRRVVTPQRVVHRTVVRKEGVVLDGTNEVNENDFASSQDSVATWSEEEGKAMRVATRRQRSDDSDADVEQEDGRWSPKSRELEPEASMVELEPVSTSAMNAFAPSGPPPDKAMVLIDLDDDVEVPAAVPHSNVPLKKESPRDQEADIPDQTTGHSLRPFWSSKATSLQSNARSPNASSALEAATPSIHDEANDVPVPLKTGNGPDYIPVCTPRGATLPSHDIPSVHDTNVDPQQSDSDVPKHALQAPRPCSDTPLDINDGHEPVSPCSLTWRHVSLPHSSSSSVHSPAKYMLDDVSGSIASGEFLVVTGPSQQESLALLSCLAGDEDTMDGSVLVNGHEWTATTRHSMAYVRPDTLFLETLTVYEHLVYHARLRRRRTQRETTCAQQVERVVQDLGLGTCRDTLIGGHSLAGISRTERTRLALATACLTKPSILFVEDPTAGLDPLSTEKMVATLRWLALARGMLVIGTVQDHHSYWYEHLDRLYLVADASCVYHGKACNAMAYFDTIGYPCPEYTNPMEFFMLQMGRGDHDVGGARVATLKQEWRARRGTDDAVTSNGTLVHDSAGENRYDHLRWWGQVYLLGVRHLRGLSRYHVIYGYHLMTVLLIGVLFGLVYLHLDVDGQHGVQNYAGALFNLVVVQMLVTAYRTFTFVPHEMALALQDRQEYRGKWYGVPCWYCTKLVAELPALLLLSIALFGPVFLLVGINHGFNVYVYMQLVVFFAGGSAIALVYLTLSVLHQVTRAVVVYTLVMAVFIVFGGFLSNGTLLPDWLKWLQYLSPVHFAYAALMHIFWQRIESIACDGDACVARTGNDVLAFFHMATRSAQRDTLLLLALSIAFLLVALWRLVHLSTKRKHGLAWRYKWYMQVPWHPKAPSGTFHATTDRATSLKRVSVADDRRTADESDPYYIQVHTPRVSGLRDDGPGGTLSWSNLYLQATNTSVPEKSAPEYLLSGATGTVTSGHLTLLTGPSIESNEALLATLSGRLALASGTVTVNNVACSAHQLAQYTASVPRCASFYEMLTVEEHLRYQALLVHGTEHVAHVLDELDLTLKRYLRIRSLSPADTQWLAIATQLLRHPSILLLDEPTSGMDGYVAQRTVLKLRELAQGGRTVLVAMARPAAHLYTLFDSLYLLAEGGTVYQGPVPDAVPYFAAMGFPCPRYWNPVDYFVRFLSVQHGTPGTKKQQTTQLKASWTTRALELGLTTTTRVDDTVSHGAVMTLHGAGCWGLLSLLFRRHLLQLARYRLVNGWHGFWATLFGLFLGLLFLQLDVDKRQSLQTWAGAFFSMIVVQMMVCAMRTFVFLSHDRAIAAHEYRCLGRYYLVCWYLSRIVAEVPVMLVLSVVLFVPVYLLIGIGHGFKLYVSMQLVMWLAGYSASALVHFLLGLFHRVRLAIFLYMVLMVLFVVFGGLLVNVDDVRGYFIWVHYVSPVKYGYEALMKLFWAQIDVLACSDSDERESGSFVNGTVASSGSSGLEVDCIAHSGDEVLAYYSIKSSRSVRSDAFILLGLAVMWFLFGYAALLVRWRWFKTQWRY